MMNMANLSAFQTLSFWLTEKFSEPADAVVLPAWLFIFPALLIDWIVEIPVLLIMVRILFPPQSFSYRRVIVLGLIMSLITAPGLIALLDTWYSTLAVLIGESLVILIEAGILAFGLKIKFFRALLMSLAANVLSLLAGYWFLEYGIVIFSNLIN
jgi:hypothetical protein